MVFKKGNSQYSKNFGLHYSKNSLETIRVGFVVSKKVSNKAVVRNRLKRILREYFSQNIKNLIVGYDIIILARNDFSNQTGLDIEVDLKSLLKKAALYKNE